MKFLLLFLILLLSFSVSAEHTVNQHHLLAQYRHDLQIENDRLQSELEKERDRLKDMERQLNNERERYRFEEEALKRKERQKRNDDLLIRGIY